jgi:tetratricopeptide (TPR) repeat protein
MNARRFRVIGGLATVVFAVALIAPAYVAEEQFTLTAAIPNDVFFCAAERHNPEREFLCQYWGEVIDAFKKCGIGDDVFGLLGSLMGEKEMARVEELKERASQLLAGVDWDQLTGGEMVFAERFDPPKQILGQRPPVLLVDFVFLFRGNGDGATQNYQGLVAILEGMADEINKAVGAEGLVVEQTRRMNAEVASLNLLGMIPAAPRLPVSVAQRDDVVAIALGEQILNDVLGLLDGSGSKQALVDDARFRAAFAELPPAEDSMVFFDMRALLKSLQALADTLIATVGTPGDVYMNTGQSSEANQFTAQALAAYQRGDIEEALALTKQAHAAAPEDSIALYNLACFHALLGHKQEALGWLEKAVEGGFYAPGKIASDPDLESLRNEPRYKAALAKAGELAAGRGAKDIIINSSKTGEAYKLYMQAWEVYEDEDYEQGLKLMEQAYAADPQDCRPLWGLACFHALLGHDDEALTWLDKAVEGGFYCPQHIFRDPDLESVRGDERYEAAIAKAGRKAAKLQAEQAGDKLTIVKLLVDRLMSAVGVLDYAATVESTDGYAVQAESITVLVPDAKNRAIYPVFGKRPQMTDFDRYLPQETASFSVSGGFDLGELYKFIEDTFRAAGPKGEELLATWAEVQAEYGFDVKKDVIGWIDGDFISVTLEGNQGSVWLIKVTNEQVAREKVGAAIEFLSTAVAEAAAENPPLAMLGAMLAVRTSPVQHEQLEGFQNIHFGMSPEPIVWGVTDSYLIFGTSADGVGLCLETAKGAHPNIRQNARVISEALVPSGPFTSVSLTDKRKFGEELAGLMGGAAWGVGILGAFAPEDEARLALTKIAGMLAKLTPVVHKIDFYKSAASCTTFDGQAWRTRAVTHYVSPAERKAAGGGGTE